MKRLLVALLVSLVLLSACSAPASPPPTSPPTAPETIPAPTPTPTPTLTPSPPVDESKVHFEQGNIYLEQEQWREAITEFSKAIEINPEFAEAYANRALAHLEQIEYRLAGEGEYNFVIADCEKALELDPLIKLNVALARAYVYRGNYYFERLSFVDPDYYRVIADYTMAMKIDPLIVSRRPVDVYLDLAGHNLDFRQYDAAIKYYTKALELDSGDNEYIYRKLAEAYYGRGYNRYKYSGFPWDEAIADYTKAIELDPTNAKYYRSRGHVYDQLAYWYLDEAANHYQRDNQLFEEAAIGLIDSSHKAIADYSKSIELNPDAGWGYYRGRGDLYALSADYTGVVADYSRAIADYSKVIELGEISSSIYWSRAIAYEKLGNREQALTDYKKAIDLAEDAKTKEYILENSESLQMQEQQDADILEYTKAIELNPQSAEAYAMRALAHYRKGLLYSIGAYQLASVSGAYQLAMADYNRAIVDYDRAIELNPIEAAYYELRGWAYSELGEHDLAIADYTESIRLDPNEAGTYNHRGLSYASKGDHAGAIVDYTKAIELNPESDQYYYNRGNSYADLGMNDEALSDYRKFLTLSDNEDLKRIVGYYIEELQSD